MTREVSNILIREAARRFKHKVEQMERDSIYEMSQVCELSEDDVRSIWEDELVN